MSWKAPLSQLSNNRINIISLFKRCLYTPFVPAFQIVFLILTIHSRFHITCRETLTFLGAWVAFANLDGSISSACVKQLQPMTGDDKHRLWLVKDQTPQSQKLQPKGEVPPRLFSCIRPSWPMKSLARPEALGVRHIAMKVSPAVICH